jgi:hypothetical protein
MTTTDTPSTAVAPSFAPAPFINDLDSFEAITRDVHAVAGLYFFQQLDCVVQLAHRIADDFYARPHLYVEVEDPTHPRPSIGRLLAKLHARFGTDETLPSHMQRSAIFMPIFGSGIDLAAAESGNFPALRDSLLAAAAAFAQTGVDSGIDMLRGGFRTAAGNLLDYLNYVAGDSVRTSRALLGELTEGVTYTVLRSPGIAHVFGVTQAPLAAWPYTPDSTADKLVALASASLDSTAPVSADRISSLNRAALRGAEALAMLIDSATVIDSSDSRNDAELDELIKKCYTWGVAMTASRSK